MRTFKRRVEMGEKEWAEYQKERQNKKANDYKRKNSDKVVNWRRRAKINLINYLGGKCQICGYNKMIPSAYDFHHKDPSEKAFSISGKTLSFDKLKKEADKCILTCRNCHAEIHDKDYEEKRISSIKKWEDKEKQRLNNA